MPEKTIMNAIRNPDFFDSHRNRDRKSKLFTQTLHLTVAGLATIVLLATAYYLLG